MAARLPRVRVMMAMKASSGSQTSRAEARGPMKIRSRKATEAALDATER